VLQLAVTTSFFPGTEGSTDNSGIVTVFKDITESKALDRARQRVIDHLSHELKTPLAIAEATLHRIDGREYETFVRRIERCLERLREIQQEVGDIVRRGNARHRSRSGFSALEQTVTFLEMVAERDTSCAYTVQALKEEIERLFPKAEITPEPLEIGGEIEALGGIVREKAAHRDVAFSVSHDDGLKVWIDRGAFRNVLTALVKNAIEATPDGGRVGVSARREGGRIQIAVEDTGVGIMEESRKEIFGGFYHARDTQVYSTKEPFDFGAGGKGLDLLRVRLLSTAYSFDIECESRRCRFLPDETILCPGSVEKCTHVGSPGECAAAGGTTFRLLFMPWTDAEEPSGTR
jgi:signal transduction histidine kinase